MGLQAKLDFHILREFFDLFVKKDFDPINPLIFHPMQILNLIFLHLRYFLFNYFYDLEFAIKS
jgi:hypothetical protein